MKPLPAAWAGAQWLLTGVALQRLARGKDRRPPLVARAADSAGGTASSSTAAADRGDAAGAHRLTLSVVIPARDEELRIAGVLGPLRGVVGIDEVIVVDDRSSDRTAEIAREHGARVVSGAELPDGWIGKPWALQQGLAAATSDLVVFLDADVEPDPALPRAVAGLLEDGADLASAQLRFICPDLAQRVLHPALLMTLVYRVGPLDVTGKIPAAVTAINGQCFAVRREALLGAGGFGLIAALPTDDVALARALAAAGWKVAVADGSALGAVRMYVSAGEAIREWAGRSLALPGAAGRARQLLDLGVVWAVQGLPGLHLWWALARLTATGSPRRAVSHLGPRQLVLLAVRAALAVALTKVYRRGGRPDPASLLAPVVDPIAAAALTRGTLAPVREWRGRRF